MFKYPRMIKWRNLASLTILLLISSSLVLSFQLGLDGNGKPARATRLRRSTCRGRGCHAIRSQPRVGSIRHTAKINKHFKRSCRSKLPQTPHNVTRNAQQDVDEMEERLESFKTQMKRGRTLIPGAKWPEVILKQRKNATNSPQDVDHIERRLEAFKSQMKEGRTLLRAAKWTNAILQQKHEQDLEDEQDCIDEEREEKEAAEEEKQDAKEAAEEEQQEKEEAAEEQKKKDLAEKQKKKQEAIQRKKQEDLQKAKDAEDQAKLEAKKEKEKKEKAQAVEKSKEVKKGEAVKSPVPINQLVTVIPAPPKPNPQPVVVKTGTIPAATSNSSGSNDTKDKQLCGFLGSFDPTFRASYLMRIWNLCPCTYHRSSDSSQFSSSETSKHGSQKAESESARWVAFHNSIRNKYFTPPVKWREDLSLIAKKVSDTCVFQHSKGATGENIAAGEMELEKVVHDWAFGDEESSVYDPSNPIYSHFTQIVWKRTTHIGCAYTDCASIKDVPWTGNSKFWVCEYDPPGNYAGQFIDNVNAAKGGSPMAT